MSEHIQINFLEIEANDITTRIIKAILSNIISPFKKLMIEHHQLR